MIDIALGIVLFIGIVLSLSLTVIVARALLLPSLSVNVNIDGHHSIVARTGDRLLDVLNGAGLSVPAACGGRGTCGQCRVSVLSGGGEAFATEVARLARRDVERGVRLACQVVVRGDLALSVPGNILDAKRWNGRVCSSRTVAPLIRELVIELPADAAMRFRAGAFVQVEAPAYRLPFSQIEVAPEHRDYWEYLHLRELTGFSAEPASRAYSIANTPGEGCHRIVLLVRLALPPPSQHRAAPGVVSSYLFGLRAGDDVSLSGPFGQFGANDSDREMVFLGGGVGMAPLRAIIADQLERVGTQRRISFWYGARSRIELFYVDEFDRLQQAHENFTWTVALSDPAPEDGWEGASGFIHEVLLHHYLRGHPAPEDCEYYLCGPPLMIRAALSMLEDLGVEPDSIFNDDFGD